MFMSDNCKNEDIKQCEERKMNIYSKRYYKLANSAIVNEAVVVEGDRYDEGR